MRKTVPAPARRGDTIRHAAWGASLVALGAAAAAPSHGESLNEALVAAYGANAQLKAERAQLEVTNEGVPQALSAWRPTVSVLGQEGMLHESSKQNCIGTSCVSSVFNLPNGSSQNLSPQSYGLTVTQSIYRGGQTEAQTAEAINLVRSERANLVATEEAVFLQVVSDYLGVVEARSAVDLNVENEQILRKLKDGTAARYHLGELTHTDAQQAEGFYAQAIAQRQEAEGQLEIARAAYEHDVGHPPGALAMPAAAPELPAARDEAVSLAGQANPNIVRAQYAREAAEDNVRAVRSQLLPSLSVQASIQRQKEATGVGLTADYEQIIAQLTMPLYEGGLIYSQSRAAQKTVSVRENQVDDARRAAVQSAGQSWDGLQAAVAAKQSLEASVRADELALKGIEQEEAIGSRTLQDVLIQEQTLFQARLALLQTQHDEAAYKFALAAAVGRLTARNLGLPVEYYDPDDEFEAVRDKWIGFGTDK